MLMRRLFSDKAGATFNENLPSVIVNVRKDCVDKKHSHLPSAIFLIDICNELSNNPPFLGWKDGLDELWN